MTIQEKIDQVVEMVKENLREELTQEEREDILANVEDLGYQWQHTNATAKATLAVVGMTIHDDSEMFDINNMEQLHQLEAEGSMLILREVGLPMYSQISMEFLDEALGHKDEEE